MGFRAVIVNARSRCEFRLGYLVIRKNLTDEQRIFLDEINTIIFSTTAISLTAVLLNECAKRNIKIVFCDNKGNPSCECLSYRANSNVIKRCKEQFSWNETIKDEVWAEIVKCKIQNQANTLSFSGYLSKARELMEFSYSVKAGDITNREGHAAKVYFNTIMPIGVQRHSGGSLNSCLDYGYICLLSLFNQSVVSNGYLTEIGIHHCSENNPFNFPCDLIEPFRFIVDRLALEYEKSEKTIEFKKFMHRLFECKIGLSDGKTYEIFTSVNEYTRCVIRALNAGDLRLIKYPIDMVLDV